MSTLLLNKEYRNKRRISVHVHLVIVHDCRDVATFLTGAT